MPAPGSYSVSLSLKGEAGAGSALTSYSRGSGSTASATASRAASQGVGQRPKVKPDRQPAPAAIPSRLETRGYDLLEDGSVVKNPAAVAKPTDIGPGRYNLTGNNMHSTTARYKGVSWSKQSGVRSLAVAQAREGPGPGSYGQDHSLSSLSANPVASIASRRPPVPFGNTQSRSLVTALTESDAPAVPAPSSYRLPSDFDPRRPGQPQHFGSTAKRFPEKLSSTPSPGAYEVTPPQLGVTRGGSRGRAPPATGFSSSGARFTVPHASSGTPGPDLYRREESLDNSVAAHVRRKTRAGHASSFGSTDVRTASLVSRDRVSLPGPGTYESISGEARSQAAAPGTATFLSSVARMPSPRVRAPPPSAYSPSGHPGRGSAGFASGFRSTSLRTNLPVAPGHDSPAPNSYTVANRGRTAGGRILDHDTKRFGTPDTKVPGPNSYTIAGGGSKVSGVGCTLPLRIEPRKGLAVQLGLSATVSWPNLSNLTSLPGLPPSSQQSFNVTMDNGHKAASMTVVVKPNQIVASL